MNRVLGVAASAAIFMCGAAQAQTTTNTTCNNWTGQLQCTSTTERRGGFNDAYARTVQAQQSAPTYNGPGLIERMNNEDAQLRDNYERERRAEHRQWMFKMLADGRCDDAKAMAASDNDLAMLQMLTDECKPK